MSSFKSIPLFASGPHRFRVGDQGEEIVAKYIVDEPPPGTVPQGLRELDVTVEGRLVAPTESALWALRDAMTAQLAHPPAPGTLIDAHGRAWEGMSFIAYQESRGADRGRVRSVAYRATFRRFV